MHFSYVTTLALLWTSQLNHKRFLPFRISFIFGMVMENWPWGAPCSWWWQWWCCWAYSVSARFIHLVCSLCCHFRPCCCSDLRCCVWNVVLMKVWKQLVWGCWASHVFSWVLSWVLIPWCLVVWHYLEKCSHCCTSIAGFVGDSILYMEWFCFRFAFYRLFLFCV